MSDKTGAHVPEEMARSAGEPRKPEPSPESACDEVDEASWESFPASDPPAWGPVTGEKIPAPEQEPDESD